MLGPISPHRSEAPDSSLPRSRARSAWCRAPVINPPHPTRGRIGRCRPSEQDGGANNTRPGDIAGRTGRIFVSETTESLDITTDPQLNLLGDTVPATSGRGRRGERAVGHGADRSEGARRPARHQGHLGHAQGRPGRRDHCPAERRRRAGDVAGHGPPTAPAAAEPSRTEPTTHERRRPSGPSAGDLPTERRGRRPSRRNGASRARAVQRRRPSDIDRRRRPGGDASGEDRGRRCGRPAASPPRGDEGGQRNRRNRRNRRDRRDGGPSAMRRRPPRQRRRAPAPRRPDRAASAGQPRARTGSARPQDGQRATARTASATARQNRDTQNRDTQNRPDTRQGQSDGGNRRDDDDGRRPRSPRSPLPRPQPARPRAVRHRTARPSPRSARTTCWCRSPASSTCSTPTPSSARPGYLTGPNDVYVSLSQVRKNGLRRGDAVTGAVRAQREGEQQRQKFNALVRLDTVNGLDAGDRRATGPSSPSSPRCTRTSGCAWRPSRTS